jgi:hypothetical protein
MLHTAIAALVLGAFVWEALQLRHRTAYGLAHGAAVCLAVGMMVGWRARRPGVGAAVGPLIGVAAAGLFYMLAPMLRYNAMFPAWMFFWLCFALLQEQLEWSRDYRFAAIRGLAAALLSGLAFYAISGIWTQPSPEGPDYVRNFISWTFAFLPGFAALFVGKRQA